MRYNSDTVAPHAAITGIAESYMGEQNLQRSATLFDKLYCTLRGMNIFVVSWRFQWKTH
jgi:hypothetical protein